MAQSLGQIGCAVADQGIGDELESLDLRRYQDGKLLCSRPLGESCVKEYGAPWL